MKELRDRWALEAIDSDLGLWWLADDVREQLPNGISEDEVRRYTIKAIVPLLEECSLRAVTINSDGSYEYLQGTAAEILMQIENTWAQLDRQPDIGEVVWFIGRRPHKPY